VKRQALSEIVANAIEADPSALSPETELRTLPGFDSVNLLSLMISLDEQANIKLGPELASRLRLYGEIEQAALDQGIELED
jgi:acyl carrier protein